MCPQCSMLVDPGQTTCPNCGSPVDQARRQPPLVRVGGLGTVVAVLMGISGAGAFIRSLPQAGIAWLDVVWFPVFIVLGLAFVAWLFLVRRNAGRWGPQRRHVDWAIVSWFVPFVMLWFPYQIADDAWRASRPRTGGTVLRSRGIVIGWWLCWLVAWTDALRDRMRVVIGPGMAQTKPFELGSTVVGGVFCAAAAVFGITMVLTLSRWQRQRVEESRLVPTG